MKTKVKREHSNSLFLILLGIFILLFSSINQQTIINLIFFLICPILLLFNRKLLILIYMITLPTNGFISSEYSLLGVIHLPYIINFFTLIALYYEWKSLPKKTINGIRKVKGVKKFAYWLTVGLLSYLILTNFRLFFLGIENFPNYKLTTRTVKYAFRFIPLLILIKLSYLETYKKIIRKGFLISLAIIAFSMIFAQHLFTLGFTIQEAEQFAEVTRSDDFIRRAGLFIGYGDVNSAAGFIAIGFAYTLFALKKKWLVKYSLLVLLFLAIVVTGSRAGSFTLVPILLMYFLSREISFSRKLFLTAFTLTVSIIWFLGGFPNLLGPLLERFRGVTFGEGHLDPNRYYGRVGGWAFYVRYLASNLQTFFLGASVKSPYVTLGLNHRVAHNFFIQLWYYWGIMPLVVLVVFLIRMVKQILKSSDTTILLALFTPFFITLFFVSGIGVALGFIVALSILSDRVNSYSKKIVSSK